MLWGDLWEMAAVLFCRARRRKLLLLLPKNPSFGSIQQLSLAISLPVSVGVESSRADWASGNI